MSFPFRFYPIEDSTPRIYVYYDYLGTEPLAPGDYTPYTEIELPHDAASWSNQLGAASAAIAQWKRHYPGRPFGHVVGFELAFSATASIFLNEAGQFESSIDPGGFSISYSDGHAREYVIGHRAEEFCSIVSDEEGESADDQDLFYAKRFSSLDEANAAADQMAASVFVIKRDGEGERLHELLVDPALAAAMPFEGCYQVVDQLIAGATFLRGKETVQRLEALAAIGITSIVSLIDPAELRGAHGATESFASSGSKPRFEENYFAVTDGTAPSANQMQVILDVIDGAYLEGKKIFLHCFGGRGRTGTVVGCWLKRHGIARGRDALDQLTDLRFACGLFPESPETEEQRRCVTQWEAGR